MAIELQLVRQLNSWLKPEQKRFAKQLIDAYTKLAEELDAQGAGTGTWNLHIVSVPYGDGDGSALLIRLHSGGIFRHVVALTRTFIFESGAAPVLENTLMTLDASLQGKGLADVINRVGVDLISKVGGQVINIHANLDVGGYAWLRKGAWPEGGAKVLDEIIQEGLRLVKPDATLQTFLDLWKQMSETEKRAFVLTHDFRAFKPLFMGSDWAGRVDLSQPGAKEAFTGSARASLPEVAADATANEIYRDATLRHQIGLRRYGSGLANRVAMLLNKADRDLTEQLRTRLARFEGEGRQLDYTGERWKALLKDMADQRTAALNEASKLVRTDLTQLSAMEGAREVAVLAASIPIQLDLASIAPDQLRAILTSKPFHGRLLGDWFKELKLGDQRRLVQTLQIGMVQGKPVDDLVRDVVGTRANAYADGILAVTRRDATAVVRTAVNHVSNTARGYVWAANQDIIQAEIWTATLDGRTSAGCRGRDGHGAPVGDNELPPGIRPLQPPDVRPPGHINCRSIMVAYLNGIGMVGRRPTVTDIRTRRKREIDFRAEAKRTGRPIQDIRKEWAAKNVGGVPASTNYEEFLMRQSTQFQDEVLGPTKADLFRKGGLRLDQFIDREGNELTLHQLSETHPEAFRRAGIDPLTI